MRHVSKWFKAILHPKDSPTDGITREFLTGFHKRKKERIEEKKAKRKEREKQERLEARRQVRAF